MRGMIIRKTKLLKELIDPILENSTLKGKQY